MVIVYASKSGDAFGKVAYQGMSRREKQLFARKKAIEEEVKCDVFNTSLKYREYIKKQRQALGLE
jgi:hypothetical protein